MFITLEGIEGSGKTSQMDHIARFLEKKGRVCQMTREPGGTDIGAKIRNILLDPVNEALDPMAELLLYVADRAQHVRSLIQPALAAGKTVLCDRYFDATLVYQGFARGLDKELIKTLHKIILNDLKPDVTLLLDLPPATGLARAWRRIEEAKENEVETRFEKEALKFHEAVRNGYLELARLEPERFFIIDAAQDQKNVSTQIDAVLETVLES